MNARWALFALAALTVACLNPRVTFGRPCGEDAECGAGLVCRDAECRPEVIVEGGADRRTFELTSGGGVDTAGTQQLHLQIGPSLQGTQSVGDVEMTLSVSAPAQ